MTKISIPTTIAAALAFVCVITLVVYLSERSRRRIEENRKRINKIQI